MAAQPSRAMASSMLMATRLVGVAGVAADVAVAVMTNRLSTGRKMKEQWMHPRRHKIAKMFPAKARVQSKRLNALLHPAKS